MECPFGDCEKEPIIGRLLKLTRKDLQQPFTRWFHRTRPIRRGGQLWTERFKNTVLENSLAVRESFAS